LPEGQVDLIKREVATEDLGPRRRRVFPVHAEDARMSAIGP
jgi:hypothetical protein